MYHQGKSNAVAIKHYIRRKMLSERNENNEISKLLSFIILNIMVHRPIIFPIIVVLNYVCYYFRNFSNHITNRK